MPKDLAFIALFVVANCVIAAPLIKLYARALTLKQALLISIQAFVPTSIALAAYFVAKTYRSFSPEFDGVATVVAMSIAGIIITVQAKRRYGIVKNGWLGVGAKTALTLMILSWLLFAMNLTRHVLS